MAEYLRESEILTGNHERAVYLGRLAIRSEFLGINDPLTHLYQYLERGEESLIGIIEDIETDIAERLPNMPFVNKVDFDFTGNDFVSAKDKVSMRLMTGRNLEIVSDEAKRDPSLSLELARAEIEADEADKLSDWFKTASIGSFMIFESLPIGQQGIAISRIYRKKDYRQLEGGFVSLHQPTIANFNELRWRHGVGSCESIDELEILRNNYEFNDFGMDSMDEFVDYYTGCYDSLLSAQTGVSRRFGVEDGGFGVNDGLNKVRNQPKLTSIYVNTIRLLANGRGMVTDELIGIIDKLGINHMLMEGENISVKFARDLLDSVIRGIASVIDRADDKLLSDLESFDVGSMANCAAISHFSDQARSEGENYDSIGCPEFSRNASDSSDDTDGFEFDSMIKAFNVHEKLDDFGKPKIGVCRISNCPSRGNLSWMPDKTLVGGCDICVCCHKIFASGKKPDKIYEKQKTNN